MAEPTDLFHDEVDRFGGAIAGAVGVEAGEELPLPGPDRWTWLILVAYTQLRLAAP